MPTYDYECEACKKHFEIYHSIRETKKKCPACGANRLARQIGPGAGFIFKGSGFYITDYRNSDYQSRAKAETESSKGGEKPAEKSADKPAGKSGDKAQKKAKK